MNGNTFFSIRDLSHDDNMAAALWLSRLADEVDCFGRNEEMQILYNALVKALDLEEHSRKVVAAMISLQKKNGNLTVRKGHNLSMHPFDYRGDVDVSYKEDNAIYDRCGNFASGSKDDINLVRAVFAGKRCLFPELVKYTFFILENKSRKTFTLPERDWKIPEEYNRYSEDLNKVSVMADAFKLSKDEADIMNVSYVLHTVKELFHIAQNLFEHEDKTREEIYATCLGKPIKDVKKLLRRDSRLITYGLVVGDGELDQDAVDCIYSGDLNTYFCDVLKEDDPKKEVYPLDSFSVKEKKTNLSLRLLKNSNATNILLYGAPGAGKTEYARSLVKESGLKSLLFKNELEVNGSKDDSGNRALSRLNCLLSLQKNDTVIIVDEAESLLGTRSNFFGSWFLSEPDKKGTVNKMLEGTTNKIIWILNYTKPLDESTLRRFTYSIEFKEMSRSMLQNIADTKLNTVPMEEALHNEIVNLCGKYHVTGASVDNMVKTVQGFDMTNATKASVMDDVKEVLESNSTLLFGKKKMRETVRPSYDLSILNTTTPPEKIFRMVRNAENFAEKNSLEPSGDTGIRMLFYGVSGTGKTELARYIAEKLEKKIILKRASDILDKYVGESEQKIKKAFEEAEATGDILLFDEADSFFADRTSARNSWERTQVNEFLTQMEEFSGILICTTNLRQIMDPAMQRRFHILSEFKPLTRFGIERLLSKYFGSYSFTESDVDRIEKYHSATPGDFGSLAGKIRFLDECEISSKMIVEDLCRIQEEKDGADERRIGFGAA